MAIWIDDDLCGNIKKYVNNTWPEKRVICICKPRSWQSSRYIQIATVIKDMDIHYECIFGRIQLHFEGKFKDDEYKPLLRYLRKEVSNNGKLQWRHWGNMKQGACEVNCEIETWEDFTKCLSYIINCFDPLIADFIEKNSEMFPNQKVKEFVPKLFYKIEENNEYKNPKSEIKTVREIPFDKLTIPPYQRPYKWTKKNVNQLITDLLTFKDCKQYRLGTLVLHNEEIVDGQQRIITLILLIKKMIESLKDEKKKEHYKDFVKKVDMFTNNTQFSNRYSLHNVIENLHAIEARESDFDDSVLDFVLNKCEFVVIGLGDISEAFQFFDSQNARGKDLEAHDLLKAYHLREILDLTENDSENIENWQHQRTEFLKEIFLILYRAKEWSQGKTARYFTKNRTDVFKGISIKEGKRYPFCQKEVIAHIFSEFYNNNPMRQIDQNKMEYPFNLDDQIVNGSRFFDMIRHYMNLYRKIKRIDTYPKDGKASEIMKCINDYEGIGRTGDQYVKNMFNTLMLYYVDRFDMEEIDKIMPKFFIWAYKLRLESSAVQLASVDNYAKDYDSMLRHVHDAKTPYDIINLSQEGITQNAITSTKCDKIVDMFKKFNKIYNNG